MNFVAFALAAGRGCRATKRRSGRIATAGQSAKKLASTVRVDAETLEYSRTANRKGEFTRNENLAVGAYVNEYRSHVVTS